MNKKYLSFIKKFLPIALIPILALGAYFAGGNYQNLGGGGGTINTLGGSLKIGANVISGTPDSILYIDTAGKLAQDASFVRDSSTYATGIIMPQNGGVDEAGIVVDNDVFGVPGTNGIVMRRGDTSNSVGDVLIGLLDGTPLGAPSAYIGFMRADDFVTGEFFQQYFFPQNAGMSVSDGTDAGLLQIGIGGASLGSDNNDGGGNDTAFFESDLDGGLGAQHVRMRVQQSGTGDNGIEVNTSYISFDFGNFNRSIGTFFDIDSAPTMDDQVLFGYADGHTEWGLIPAASASLTATRIGYGDSSDLLTGNANFTYEDTYSLLTQIIPVNSDSLTYSSLNSSSVSGLDDLTLTWNSSIYASNKYGGSLTISIDGTGSPDTFTWQFTGSFSQTIGSGSGVAITGGVQTLNDTDGNKIAEIQFGSDTGHTLSDSWSASTSLGGNQKGFILRDTSFHEFLSVLPNGGAFRFGDDGTNGGSTWWGNGTNLTIQDGIGEIGIFAPRYLRIEPPNGNTIVLADMASGIWSQYGDFRILDSATSSVWFRSDTANRITFIGDTQGAGNDTLFYVDDVSQTISSTINGTVLIQNVGGSDFFNLNTTTGTVSWGDIGGSGNSLRYTLDDVNKTITENSQDGFWYAGDVDGLFNGTVIALNDSNGRIGLTATLTQIGGAYSIGLQTEAPATGATVNISSDKSVLILNPAGTLASLTVAMPASPVVGQIVYVATKQTITSISFTATAGVNGAPSTLAANTDTVGFVYISGSLGWQAISH